MFNAGVKSFAGMAYGEKLDESSRTRSYFGLVIGQKRQVHLGCLPD